MNWLWWFELSIVIGLFFFAFVNHVNRKETLPHPWAFYTLGFVGMVLFWWLFLITFIWDSFMLERVCSKCKRPVPKENKYCLFCTQESPIEPQQGTEASS